MDRQDLYRRLAGRIQAGINVASGRNSLALWLIIEIGQKDSEEYFHLITPSPAPEPKAFLERNNHTLIFTGSIPVRLTLSFRDLRDWRDEVLIQVIEDAVQKILDEAQA